MLKTKTYRYKPIGRVILVLVKGPNRVQNITGDLATRQSKGRQHIL